MKKEWFEPGPDGVSPFERLSATVGFGAAGTAAAFRALLAAEDVGRTADAKDAEIVGLRAEVERLQGELQQCNSMNRDLTAERDALRARIDAGVRAWEKWKQQCGSLWLWAFPGVTASQEWSDVCDALDADYVVYPIAEADERKGKADRREIGCDASYEARIAIGRDHTREYQTEDIDCDGTIKCARSNDRRRTAGTIADRGKAS